MSARMTWAGVSSGMGASGSGRVGLTPGGVCDSESSNEVMDDARSCSWYLRVLPGQLDAPLESALKRWTHWTTPRL